MKYSEYLEQFVDDEGSLREPSGNNSVYVFIPSERGGRYQLKEVNEDFVIVEVEGVNEEISIPMGLFVVSRRE